METYWGIHLMNSSLSLIPQCPYESPSLLAEKQSSAALIATKMKIFENKDFIVTFFYR